MKEKEFVQEEDKLERIARLVKEFLLIIGEDPEREGLRETPSRVAKMWLEELTIGYRESPESYVKKFKLEVSNKQDQNFVVIRGIPVKSICEHHLMPFFGEAHIMYIPEDEVLGFSKFARIINIYSKRLQLQERLTNQIADGLMNLIKAKGLIIVVNALHTCALIRGVEEPMYMTTYAERGVLATNAELREKALKLLFGKSSHNIDYDVRFLPS